MTTQTATAPVTARICSPEGRVTRSLLGYGPLAGTVFVGSTFIQGLTRRGFSIPHDDASLLANGPLGWIQVATFLVAGAMTIAAAADVHRALPSRWAPRLIASWISAACSQMSSGMSTRSRDLGISHAATGGGWVPSPQ